MRPRYGLSLKRTGARSSSSDAKITGALELNSLAAVGLEAINSRPGRLGRAVKRTLFAGFDRSLLTDRLSILGAGTETAGADATGADVEGTDAAGTDAADAEEGLLFKPVAESDLPEVAAIDGPACELGPDSERSMMRGSNPATSSFSCAASASARERRGPTSNPHVLVSTSKAT